MAFTLQKFVSKKRVFLVKDYETFHRPDRLYGDTDTEIVTFADVTVQGTLLEGTYNQNEAITFKSFAAAKAFKKLYRLTNWEINFIANPKVSHREPRKSAPVDPVRELVKSAKIQAFTL